MTINAGFGRRGINGEQPRRVFQTEVSGPVEVVITRRGPSKWRIAGYIFGGMIVLGVIGNLLDPDRKGSGTVEVAQAAPAKQTATAKCGATLKEFSSLQMGTSPATAASIIGCKGEEVSRVAFGGQETVMLSWPGEAFLSNMNATFSNGKLTAKAQLGLK